MMDRGLFILQGVKITFRNFRGEERQYNERGDRNFNVILSPDQAEAARMVGFNVKTMPPRDPDGDPRFLLSVAVSYKIRQPKVVLINNGKATELTEETVGELDFLDFDNIDLSINPYHWSLKNGNSGVKAYLNSGYFTMADDGLQAKYSNLNYNTSKSSNDDDDDTLPF